MNATTVDGKLRRSRDRLDKLMALGDLDRCLDLLVGMKALIEARIAATRTSNAKRIAKKAA